MRDEIAANLGREVDLVERAAVEQGENDIRRHITDASTAPPQDRDPRRPLARAP
jgi:hypothetical protein